MSHESNEHAATQCARRPGDPSYRDADRSIDRTCPREYQMPCRRVFNVPRAAATEAEEVERGAAVERYGPLQKADFSVQHRVPKL